MLQRVPLFIRYCFAGIIVLGIIDLLFYHTATTLFGNPFRMQGVFLLWLLLAWALISSRIKIALPAWLIVSCLAVQAVLSLLIDGGVGGRAVGTLGEPNALAAAIVFTWPFLFFTKKPVSVWIKTGAIFFVVFIVGLSGSRSGVIAFVLQSLFLLLCRFKSLSLLKRIIICLCLLLCSYALPFLQQSGPYEDRSDVWQSAVLAGSHWPILGYGFGNIQYALTQENIVLHNNLRGSLVDSSHNIFLDWWVEGGIIGVALFLAILFFVFKCFMQQNQLLHLTLLLGLLAALSFNPASVVSLVAFWWIIGQTTGLTQ